jgi:hypothetical protein
MTGHFEKGAWKDDPFIKFNAALQNLGEAFRSLTDAFKNLHVELHAPRGHFEKGRWVEDNITLIS